MKTTVSTKGQVVLPGPLRRKLGIAAGDAMDVEVEAGRIVLMPHRRQRRRAKVVADPKTGLPVLTMGTDTARLSSKDVREMLAEFP